MNQMETNFFVRFQREARALAKLDHPYILKVLDFGEENGMPYLVMPYVANGTLKQYTRTRLPYDRAIGIVLPIADALSYAHKRKIIHRDIKPANILFGESGEPILSDFGIAKILDSEEQVNLTGTGLGIGTPAYMAPEQWNGVADERTDVYALGIVLYELITGTTPFQAETPAAILLKQVQDPLPRPKNYVPDLPDHVEALIFKALAKDPALRFQTMQDFIRGMNDVLQGKTVSYHHPPPESSSNMVTQVSGKPTIVTSSPDFFQKIPGLKSKKNLVPLIIGAAVILIIGCIAVVLIFNLIKPNLQTANKGTATNSELVQDQNTNPTRVSQQTTGSSTQPTIESQTQSTDAGVDPATEIPQSVTVIDQLPEDIPVYTPNNGDVTTTTQEGTLMFSYSTNDEKSLAETFFVDEMKKLNWELVSTSDMSAQDAMMYAFTKDIHTVMVYVMGQGERTYIQIIIASEN
jgi:serine/threonine protein kinase